MVIARVTSASQNKVSSYKMQGASKKQYRVSSIEYIVKKGKGKIQVTGYRLRGASRDRKYFQG